MTSASNSSDRLRQISQKIILLIQWIIFSDIYITLGAVAFAYVNASLLGIEPSSVWSLLILVAAATMFIYQFSRWTFFKDVPDNLSRDKLYYWMERNKPVVKFLMGLSVLSGCIALFYVRFEVFLVLVGLGIISFLYNINIPVGNTILTLRKIPFAKIFMIALVWASMAVILPWTVQFGWRWELHTFQLFLLQFLFIFIITLPFDINDIQVDKEVGVRTIPITLGVKKSKILLSVLSVLYSSFFFRWISVTNGMRLDMKLFTIGVTILIFCLLYKTIVRSRRAEKWQIMLWYDGSLILYFLIYIISVCYK